MFSIKSKAIFLKEKSKKSSRMLSKTRISTKMEKTEKKWCSFSKFNLKLAFKIFNWTILPSAIEFSSFITKKQRLYLPLWRNKFGESNDWLYFHPCYLLKLRNLPPSISCSSVRCIYFHDARFFVAFFDLFCKLEVEPQFISLLSSKEFQRCSLCILSPELV